MASRGPLLTSMDHFDPLARKPRAQVSAPKHPRFEAFMKRNIVVIAILVPLVAIELVELIVLAVRHC